MASTGWRTYHRATRSATYGFLSALPLFALYETMIVLANVDATRPVRVEAGMWIKELLMMTGASGGLVLAMLVVGGGGTAYLLDRHRDVPLRSRYFAGLVGESAAYAIGVALAVSSAVGVLFAAIPPPDGALWTQLALSVGAGLYEELVFRVLLVGGLAHFLRRAVESDSWAYVLAALVGAALFSLVHYVGPLGDPFALPSFAFRFLFGLALNALFLARGFGVAAWTHALYDVMVVTGMLG